MIKSRFGGWGSRLRAGYTLGGSAQRCPKAPRHAFKRPWELLEPVKVQPYVFALTPANCPPPLLMRLLVLLLMLLMLLLVMVLLLPLPQHSYMSNIHMIFR